MLEKLAIGLCALGFVPGRKRASGQPSSIPVETHAAPQPEQVPQMAPPVAPSPPSVAKFRTKGRAVRELLAIYRDFDMDGEDMIFRLILQDYRAYAPDRGWPPITEKFLSQELERQGCEKRIQDDRRQGGGRYAMFTLPEAREPASARAAA